jgi:hypothetical protein
MEDRDTGRDARIAMRMRLFDRQGRIRERVLSVSSLRGGPGRPFRAIVHCALHASSRHQGHCLVWEQLNADDEIPVLPSLGRVRRIADRKRRRLCQSDLTQGHRWPWFENYAPAD